MQKTIIKCGLFLACFYSAISAAASPFSVRLVQAPLAATLQYLAMEQGVNLVIADDIGGNLTLQLDNVNFSQFLQAVGKSRHLAVNMDGGIYYLSPALPKSNEILDSPLSTLSIKLQFAKASEMMKSLTTGSGSLVSADGSIAFDDRSNTLIVQDHARYLSQIKKLVNGLDKPIDQIAIEARIVTISDESLKELGVRWGIFNPTDAAHRVSGSLAANGFENLTENLNVNFAAATTPAASAALQIAKINGRLLDLELTALERENSVEIIASPRLLTTNKKSASIKQGTEIPYVVVNRKSDTESVEFREAVLGLEVTPHISKDNQILLDLVVSQNSPGNRIAYGLGEIVSIDKQEINTQVSANDGETIVLGGVFHDTVTKGEEKVPLLGDIPVVKRLFSRDSERHQKRELVIFVTPHIIKAGERLPAAGKMPLKTPQKSTALSRSQPPARFPSGK